MLQVIHLDLKSHNVLLGRGGVAKVADVGLAKLLSGVDTMASCTGTFDWAAPEVLAGAPCCEKADIYSFGVLLWEICTLSAPWLRQTRDVECAPATLYKAPKPALRKRAGSSGLM